MLKQILFIQFAWLSLAASFSISQQSKCISSTRLQSEKLQQPHQQTDPMREKRKQMDAQYRPGSLMAATIETGKVPYGEKSRKYRRTIYAYSDWVSHRDSNSRIVDNLRGMLFSGIVRQLRPQVTTVALSAVVVLIWNVLLQPLMQSYVSMTTTSMMINVPLISLPSLPFTLSSPALGLLLVFRTNASYQRWLEARNTWSRMISHSKNLVRMGSTFSDDKDAVDMLSRSVWLYIRSAMNALSSPDEDETLYVDEVNKMFQLSGEINGDDNTTEEQDMAIRVMESNDRTTVAWSYMSKRLHSLPVSDPKALIETDKSIIVMGECMATCEKVFTSPVPLVYTRHTARFLSLWALLMPAALFSSFSSSGQSLILIPTASILALFLFGIDELALALEEPFSILPMKSFCDDFTRSAESLK